MNIVRTPLYQTLCAIQRDMAHRILQGYSKEELGTRASNRDAAILARIWVESEYLKRDVRGVPNPKQVDPDRLNKRKRRTASPAAFGEPTSTPQGAVSPTKQASSCGLDAPTGGSPSTPEKLSIPQDAKPIAPQGEAAPTN